MVGLEDRLTPNALEVAAKVMDGEAILINLSNGMYYSMDGVGGVVWSLVEQGRSVGEIVAAVAAHYEVGEGEVRRDVARLAEELLEERLVLLNADAAPASQPGTAVAGERAAYAPPVLNACRDMGDLLALDPPMPGLEDIPWKGAAG